MRSRSGRSSVLLGAKGEAITVRTAEQTSYVNSSPTGVGEQLRDRRTAVEQAFVAVTRCFQFEPGGDVFR